MRRLAAKVALLLCPALPGPVAAFQPLITDDTGTQGREGNQLELSLSEDRSRVASTLEGLRTLPIVYTRGLTDTLDVFAGLSHAHLRSSTPGRDASGASNPVVGVKWRFHENPQTGTSFALKPEILLPVSAGRESAGLGRGRTSGALTLIVSQQVSFGAIHVNAGGIHDDYRNASNSPHVTSTRASVAPVWELNGQWTLALDMGTESARAAGTKVRSNFVELGAIYSTGEGLEFALGAIRSSDNDTPRVTKYTATAGLTWRFR